jgi:hypothetical protein
VVKLRNALGNEKDPGMTQVHFGKFSAGVLIGKCCRDVFGGLAVITSMEALDP